MRFHVRTPGEDFLGELGALLSFWVKILYGRRHIVSP